jgi:ribose 1,5-bisphosphokinase PhnN
MDETFVIDNSGSLDDAADKFLTLLREYLPRK